MPSAITGLMANFDSRASNFSWQLWASQNRGWLTLAGAAGGLGLLFANP